MDAKYICFITFILSCIHLTSQAATYRCTDANGRTVYSDIPCINAQPVANTPQSPQPQHAETAVKNQTTITAKTGPAIGNSPENAVRSYFSQSKDQQLVQHIDQSMFNSVIFQPLFKRDPALKNKVSIAIAQSLDSKALKFKSITPSSNSNETWVHWEVEVDFSQLRKRIGFDPSVLKVHRELATDVPMIEQSQASIQNLPMAGISKTVKQADNTWRVDELHDAEAPLIAGIANCQDLSCSPKNTLATVQSEWNKVMSQLSDLMR